MTHSSVYPGLLTRIWRYVQLFLTRPTEVASVSPSSPFLTRKLCEVPGLTHAKCVVELGPGDGSTTRALLKVMPAGSRLLAIELLPELVEMLRTLKDERCLVEEGDARELGELLKRHQLPLADVIVSGIPFSNLSRSEGLEVLDEVYEALKPGGRFVAYQFRDDIVALASKRFGKPSTSFIPLNLPPVHVYSWVKTADTPGSAPEESNPRNGLLREASGNPKQLVAASPSRHPGENNGTDRSVPVGTVG